MILPIVAFGHPVLRKEAVAITADYPNLKALLNDMWATMYNAQGVGLAAPQVGLQIRIFLVDSAQLEEDEEEERDEHDEEEKLEGVKTAFINAQILDKSGEPWPYEEGCLSIPDIREKVSRPETILIRWQDENFDTHEREFSGINARIIQHEYDHIQGILFTDYLGPLKKRLLKKRLDNISKGKISVRYKMKFPG
ncbi:MAG: peptide deformylase [Limisphaerales bacterium]|jgi:peptide deformylase